MKTTTSSTSAASLRSEVGILDFERSAAQLDSATGVPPSLAFLGWQGFIKRSFDVVASAAALPLFAPLLLVVAIAIALESRGPIFFVQQREGKDGVPFRMLKFRSLRVEDCDETGIRQTIEGDPRITRVGAILRKTSIDELPQLLNVLRGEMSLVGPRPHVRGMLAAGIEYRRLTPNYDFRLAVRRGITGWAQANGLRGSIVDRELAQKRIEYDIDYIQNFSFLLDLRIISLTLKRELWGGLGRSGTRNQPRSSEH